RREDERIEDAEIEPERAEDADREKHDRRQLHERDDLGGLELERLSRPPQLVLDLLEALFRDPALVHHREELHHRPAERLERPALRLPTGDQQRIRVTELGEVPLVELQVELVPRQRQRDDETRREEGGDELQRVWQKVGHTSMATMRRMRRKPMVSSRRMT